LRPVILHLEFINK